MPDPKIYSDDTGKIQCRVQVDDATKMVTWQIGSNMPALLKDGVGVPHWPSVESLHPKLVKILPIAPSPEVAMLP